MIMKKNFTLLAVLALVCMAFPLRMMADKGDVVACWFPKGADAAADKQQGQTDFNNCVMVCHTFDFNIWAYNSSTSKRALNYNMGVQPEKGTVADDWCFLPAVELKGGTQYLCDYCVINNRYDQLDTHHEFWLCKAAATDAEMQKVHDQVVARSEMNSFSDETATPEKSFTFEVGEDGTYYLAVRLVTEFSSDTEYSGNMFNNIRLSDNGEAVGIHSVEHSAKQAPVYNLHGQCANARQRGIVISGDRKVLRP